VFETQFLLISGLKTVKPLDMKNILLIFGGMISMLSASAQLKTTPVCPPLAVDVLAGNVNKLLYPKSTLGEIKKALPCFTEVVEQSTDTKCASVFYTDKDIYFFPERNYIEIRENFKGKLTPAIMGAGRSSMFSLLGNPALKDVNWDAFQTEYGTLVVYYNNTGKINKLQISSKSTSTLKLCE